MDQQDSQHVLELWKALVGGKTFGWRFAMIWDDLRCHVNSNNHIPYLGPWLVRSSKRNRGLTKTGKKSHFLQFTPWDWWISPGRHSVLSWCRSSTFSCHLLPHLMDCRGRFVETNMDKHLRHSWNHVMFARHSWWCLCHGVATEMGELRYHFIVCASFSMAKSKYLMIRCFKNVTLKIVLQI